MKIQVSIEFVLVTAIIWSTVGILALPVPEDGSALAIHRREGSEASQVECTVLCALGCISCCIACGAYPV